MFHVLRITLEWDQLNKDIKLLQIAVLLHDAAREGDGEDQWDLESAIFIYCYLTRTLGIPPDKAKEITEAMANKDLPSDTAPFIYQLTEISQGVFGFTQCATSSERTLYQKLIHDSDCLDILRARPHFEATYLSFYKELKKREDTVQISSFLAFREMATFITEARSLISLHGDQYANHNNELKLQYDSESAYYLVTKDLNEASKKPFKKTDACPLFHYKILTPALATRVLCADEVKRLDFFSQIESEDETERDFNKKMHEGLLFARGLNAPLQIRQRPNKQAENGLELELRKTMRRIELSGKEGNRRRSVSMLSFGAEAFANMGFLFSPRLKNISQVEEIDCDSGHGKKSGLLSRAIEAESTLLDKLRALHRVLAEGGKSRHYPELAFHSTHNEIIYDITQFEAIYFSRSEAHLAQAIARNNQNVHPYAYLLQADYCQRVHARLTETHLPIFEYSAVHNSLRLIEDDELCDDKLEEMWELATSYFLTKMKENNDYQVFSLSIEDLMKAVVYGDCVTSVSASHYSSITGEYPAEFCERIKSKVQEVRAQSLNSAKEELKEKILQEPHLLFKKKTFLSLIQAPELLDPETLLDCINKLKAAFEFETDEEWVSSSLKNDRGEVGLSGLYQDSVSLSLFITRTEGERYKLPNLKALDRSPYGAVYRFTFSVDFTRLYALLSHFAQDDVLDPGLKERLNDWKSIIQLEAQKALENLYQENISLYLINEDRILAENVFYFLFDFETNPRLTLQREAFYTRLCDKTESLPSERLKSNLYHLIKIQKSGIVPPEDFKQALLKCKSLLLEGKNIDVYLLSQILTLKEVLDLTPDEQTELFAQCKSRFCLANFARSYPDIFNEIDIFRLATACCIRGNECAGPWEDFDRTFSVLGEFLHVIYLYTGDIKQLDEEIITEFKARSDEVVSIYINDLKKLSVLDDGIAFLRKRKPNALKEIFLGILAEKIKIKVESNPGLLESHRNLTSWYNSTAQLVEGRSQNTGASNAPADREDQREKPPSPLNIAFFNQRNVGGLSNLRP